MLHVLPPAFPTRRSSDWPVLAWVHLEKAHGLSISLGCFDGVEPAVEGGGVTDLDITLGAGQIQLNAVVVTFSRLDMGRQHRAIGEGTVKQIGSAHVLNSSH